MDPATVPDTALVAQHFGLSEEAAQRQLDKLLPQLNNVWINNIYLVFITTGDVPEGYVHLSIKRLDRKPIHDWRDLQRIKTELVGPECEGLELYPAESRLVDVANQFHLWVCTDPTKTMNLGMHGARQVNYEDHVGTSRQRPYQYE